MLCGRQFVKSTFAIPVPLVYRHTTPNRGFALEWAFGGDSVHPAPLGTL
jgi:hypothetical protein